MKVGTTEYLEATGLTAFRVALTTQLGTHLPQYEKLLGEISSDMFSEKLAFADWPAVVQEVAIRNVGYQAEAAMRARMVEHEARYQQQSRQAQILIEQAEKDWAEDRKKPAAERAVFQLESDKIDYIVAQSVQVSHDVLGYCKASYMSRYQTASRMQDLFRWLIDERDEEPLYMNCWEAVLFALMKAGLVDKTYIGWCNSAGNRAEFKGRGIDWKFVLLFQKLITGMDCYWGDPDPAFVGYESKKRESQVGFKVTAPVPRKTTDPGDVHFLVPEDTVIPRGRILMFDCGSHVAISTGKRVRIEQEAVRDRFNITWGHGMLELDGGYLGTSETKVIREGCIEDLFVGRKFYLINLVVAPFPACTDAGTVTLKGELGIQPEKELDYAEAKAAFLAAKSEQIEAEKTSAQKKGQEKLDAAISAQDTLMKKKEPVATTAELDAAEKLIATARKNMATQIKAVDTKWGLKADQDAVVKEKYRLAKIKVKLPETIVFNYNINNPYPTQE